MISDYDSVISDFHSCDELKFKCLFGEQSESRKVYARYRPIFFNFAGPKRRSKKILTGAMPTTERIMTEVVSTKNIMTDLGNACLRQCHSETFFLSIQGVYQTFVNKRKEKKSVRRVRQFTCYYCSYGPCFNA